LAEDEASLVGKECDDAKQSLADAEKKIASLNEQLAAAQDRFNGAES